MSSVTFFQCIVIGHICIRCKDRTLKIVTQNKFSGLFFRRTFRTYRIIKIVQKTGYTRMIIFSFIIVGCTGSRDILAINFCKLLTSVNGIITNICVSVLCRCCLHINDNICLIPSCPHTIITHNSTRFPKTRDVHKFNLRAILVIIPLIRCKSKVYTLCCILATSVGEYTLVVSTSSLASCKLFTTFFHCCKLFCYIEQFRIRKNIVIIVAAPLIASFFLKLIRNTNICIICNPESLWYIGLYTIMLIFFP